MKNKIKLGECCEEAIEQFKDEANSFGYAEGVQQEADAHIQLLEETLEELVNTGVVEYSTVKEIILKLIKDTKY